MKVAGLLLALFGLVELQVALWPAVTSLAMPAVILTAAVAWGLTGSLGGGFRLALGGGLLLDLYAQHSFGRFSLACLAGYAVLLIVGRARPEETPLSRQIGLMLAAAVVYEVILLIITALTTSRFPLFAELLRVTTLNVLSSLLLFAVWRPLFGRWRDNRSLHHARPLS
jgi:hypothetical protein